MSLQDTYGDLVGKTEAAVQQQLTNQIQEGIKSGIDVKQPGPINVPTPVANAAPATPPQQNSTQPIDNNGQIPYIAPSQQTTPPVDTQTEDRVVSYLVNTYGVKPEEISESMYKVAKSNMEQQSAFAKLQNRVKQLEPLEEGFNKLDEVMSRNPALAQLLDRAAKGETIENLTAQAPEPSGKSTPSESKLNGLPDIDENVLVQQGLLNPDLKGRITQAEWDRMVTSAYAKYVPKLIAEQSIREYETRLATSEAQRQQQQQQQALQAEWTRRYEASFGNAVAKGFDFVGNEEHKAMLPEIEAELAGLRDPQNLNLIRSDAFEIATEIVSRRKGIRPGQPTIAQVTGQAKVPIQQQISTGRENAEPELTGMAAFYNRIGQGQINQMARRQGTFRK